MAKSERRKLIEACDALCSKIVRIRDKNTCQMCGKKAEGKNAHCSHVIPKSVSEYLRHNFNNLKLLCYRCHFYIWHVDPDRAMDWFRKKFPYRYYYVRKRRRWIRDIDLEKLKTKLKKILVDKQK